MIHICPQEVAAVMIVLDSILPFASAFYYTKICPLFKTAERDK